MSDMFRKLSEIGISHFLDWLASGAKGPTPIHLLSDPIASEATQTAFAPTQKQFTNKYAFGIYLNELLQHQDATAISGDRGLWTALALFWFDQLSPLNQDGDRTPDKPYRYLLSADYRHYYRHLVRSPWQLVRDHGEHSRFLLLAASEDGFPLRRHGDILEQLGGTQAIIRSRPIIAAASLLYGNPETGRPRRSAAGKGGGSVRRFARVLRQLDLTFDVEMMPPGGLTAILPPEFDFWKKNPFSRTSPAISPSGSARLASI